MKEMMSSIIAIICIATVILSIPVFATTEREYMRVTAVDVVDSSVTVIDENGNLWSFRGYGYHPNEILIVDMYDNRTETIYDDRIVGVKRVQ